MKEYSQKTSKIKRIPFKIIKPSTDKYDPDDLKQNPALSGKSEFGKMIEYRRKCVMGEITGARNFFNKHKNDQITFLTAK